MHGGHTYKRALGLALIVADADTLLLLPLPLPLLLAPQTVTTAVRDAVHRASEGVSAAGNAAANTAAAVVDKTKEAVQVRRAMGHWAPLTI